MICENVVIKYAIYSDIIICSLIEWISAKRLLQKISCTRAYGWRRQSSMAPQKENQKKMNIFAPHSKRINNRRNCEMLLSIALASSSIVASKSVYNQRNREEEERERKNPPKLQCKCLRLPIHIEFTMKMSVQL